MSGQKDVFVERVSRQTMEAARQRREEMLRRQCELGAAQARAEAALAAALSAAASAEATQARIAQEHVEAEARLDEVAGQRRALNRRLEAMKKEALEAQRQAGTLGRDIDQECAAIDRQLHELAAIERDLRGQVVGAQAQVAAHDGGEARRAAEALAAAQRERHELARESAAVHAQLAAFAADATMGAVFDRLLLAAGKHGYQMLRTFTSESQIEAWVADGQGRTLRIALQTSQQRAAEPAPDQGLRLLLEGRDHRTPGVCIADTIRILEELQRDGVLTILKVVEDDRTGHRVDEGAPEVTDRTPDAAGRRRDKD